MCKEKLTLKAYFVTTTSAISYRLYQNQFPICKHNI